MKLRSKHDHLKLEAQICLYEEFKYIEGIFPELTTMEPRKDPDIFGILSKFYRVNIIIHQSNPEDEIVYSHPKIFNDSWPCVDLHQKLNLDRQLTHVECVITPMGPMRFNYFDGSKAFQPGYSLS